VPADMILKVASLFDLVVMGLRTYFHFETRKGPGESLDRVLDRTVTPVLAVPEKGPEELRRVLLTYDGSYGSARALRDCVDVIRGADVELTLFAADRDESHAKELVRHAAAYLRAHEHRDFSIVTTTAPAIEYLKQEFLGRVDLIVAGIHARRFFKDAFVGSFTNELICDGRTALLLSH
jgi:nucleotide-binding universal stress UspA family protein